MEIKVIPLGHIKTNCYMLSGDKAAVIIDPGFKSQITEEFLKQNQDKERLIILTHAHFDHIGGADLLRENTGVKIAIGERDNNDLANPEINLSNKFHAKVAPFSANMLLKDGEILTVGDLEFKVIETPGHTVGGISLLIDDMLFSGDTLFFESIGRTDFEGGNMKVLLESVKKLLELDENINVFSGHGPQTTISHEKQFNPFVRFLR